MDINQAITQILCDTLDITPEEIHPESYLIRELNAESIDLLELAVNINNALGITVNEDDLFLRKLRLFLESNPKIEPNRLLQEKYPFLSIDRIQEILADIDQGPVLKVKDLIHYVTCQVN